MISYQAVGRTRSQHGGMNMKPLDLRHLACPGPVMELRTRLDAGDESLLLRVGDELARSNVSRFGDARGATVRSEEDGEGGFWVSVQVPSGRPTSAGPAEAGALAWAVEGPDAAPGDTSSEVRQARGAVTPLVVQLTSDRMGDGDAGLGALLLRSFLKTLAAQPSVPDVLVCYNSGVRLACTGSDALEALDELQRRGAEVLACGTCLNFYKLKDRLRVGRVTDMLEIVERLEGAGRLVRP